MELGKAIGAFVVAKRQEGRSPGTCDKYGWHLGRLCAWLAERGVVDVEDVDRFVLREWGASIRDQWSPATCRQATVAAKSLFAWCCEDGLIGVDPGAGLRLPAVPERAQRTLDAGEIRRLLAYCDREGSPAHIRNGAIISLLVDSGLRAAEVCRLRVADVDLDGLALQVQVKGGRVDYGWFGAETRDRLLAWLSVRPAARGVEALFVAVGGVHPGQALTTRGLRVALVRAGGACGIPRVSPHAFRRSFACLASEAGAPQHVIMRAGRWSNVNMVSRYTRAMESRELYDHQGWVPMNRVKGGRKGGDDP